MNIFSKWLIRITRPIVWRLANPYDLKIQPPGIPYGRHPVEIEDRGSTLLHRIPKSTYFNTASGKIKIGKNVALRGDVKFLTDKHQYC